MSSRNTITLGLGGGCHWCTEAVFSSIKGINDVRQGWFASEPPADSFSEGVLLEIDTDTICLKDIIDIHIKTHSSDANHSKRDKYRSAVYVQNECIKDRVFALISLLNTGRDKKIITQVLSLKAFKPQSEESYIDYYFKKPDKPFCKTYIKPKLKKLLKTHGQHIAISCLPIILNKSVEPTVTALSTEPTRLF